MIVLARHAPLEVLRFSAGNSRKWLKGCDSVYAVRCGIRFRGVAEMVVRLLVFSWLCFTALAEAWQCYGDVSG
jgi:hypothetical protein